MTKRNIFGVQNQSQEFVLIISVNVFKTTPMDTSSSIRHRLDVEISRGKFVEITSILKGESTWKL